MKSLDYNSEIDRVDQIDVASDFYRISVENEIVVQLKDTSLSERDVQNILTMIKQKYGIDVGGGAKVWNYQSDTC